MPGEKSTPDRHSISKTTLANSSHSESSSPNRPVLRDLPMPQPLPTTEYNSEPNGSPRQMVMQRADSSSMSSHGSKVGYDATLGVSGIILKDDSTLIGQQIPSLRKDQNSPREEDNQGGIIASGLAWVQRNRERRRRQNLQQQAEEQLRKIVEAERGNPSATLTAENFSSKTSTSPSSTILSVNARDHADSGAATSAKLDVSGQQDEEEEFMVPMVRVHKEERKKEDDNEEGNASFEEPKYILTPEQMHQIAIYVLPKTVAYCQWRLLYGLARDGDSFDGCLRIISNVKRTLMVIRTTRGAVFGGYADSPWHSTELGNARFYGSAAAVLFSLIDPEGKEGGSANNKKQVNVFKWSGKNRYIQICDVSSKMLAFGGGGDDGAFGLCVQEDFQTGSTGPCDTFDNDPLCDQETFEIVDVEFWEFLTGVF